MGWVRASATMSSNKKVKYSQKFKIDWLEVEVFKNWVVRSNKGDDYAFCKACCTDININGGGRSDLVKHATTAKHQNKMKSVVGQRSIVESMPSTSNATSTKEAEMRLVSFQVEHNLAIRVVDHLGQVVKACCPDSKIAQNIHLGRTKATSIIKNVMGKTEKEELCKAMRGHKFSLIVDESTDKGIEKHLCLVIRIIKNNRVTDSFFDLIKIEKTATAIELYNMIKDSFENCGLPWRTNLIGFAADGANVMMGNHNSLKTMLQREVPTLFVMKCICHSFALCASYACRKIPTNVEDLVRDVYNYIQGSPKRIGIFKEFQTFVKVKPHKLLHPCQTRWLSLHAAVSRILEQYNALKLYFIDVATEERLQSTHNILENLNNPFVKLYLEFLNFILPLFTTMNKLMQSESTQIHCLRKNLETTFRTMLSYFIQSNHLERPISRIDYKNPRNFLALEDIYVGAKVAVGLQNINNAEHIKSFRLNILDFYIEGASQVCQRFSFSDIVFEQLEILDPNVVKSKKFNTLASLAARFPNLVEERHLQDLDNEWHLLQNTQVEYELPVELFWIQIEKKCFGSETPAFPHLINFIRNLLVLPHSSAAVERVFSTVNLNKTKLRNRLTTKTLCGVLHSKRAFGEKTCFNHDVTKYLKKFNNTMYQDQDSSDSDSNSD